MSNSISPSPIQHGNSPLSVMLVGESFNEPGLYGRWSDSWDTKLAMRLGAFRFGRSREFLLSLGFSWRSSANLCPPCEWDLERAKAVASGLLAMHDGVFLLAGRRPAEAFGCNLSWFEFDGRFALVPHPSGLNRLWNSETRKEEARMLAHVLRHGRAG